MSGTPIEMLINYEPSLLYLSEWWKQLFGESEGKDHKAYSSVVLRFQLIYTRLVK